MNIERVWLISIESTHGAQHKISFYVLILSGCLYETFAECEFSFKSKFLELDKSFEALKDRIAECMNAFELLALLTAKILHAILLKVKLFHSISIGM